MGKRTKKLPPEKNLATTIGIMIAGNANVEWSDEILIFVDELVDELVEKSTESDLSREEQAIVDVVETVQLIEEGDGLHDLW